jgi:hypothetical protein
VVTVARALQTTLAMRRFALVLSFLVACGDNVATYQPWLLDELAPADGFWVRTPEFPIAAGQELQDCYFFDVPDLAGGQDLWIDRFELALNTGSHHMNVFRVRTIVALDPAAGTPVDLGGAKGVVIHGADNPACWKSSNWADWPIVANSQQSAADRPIVDWKLPAGVGARFHPGEKLMLQIHYVNSTDQATPWVGRGGIDFYRTTTASPIELGTLFATQQNIRVCRSTPHPSYSGTCALPPGTHTAIAANGHFHSRGTKFRIWGWDGVSTTPPSDSAKFYESQNWAEPKMSIGLDVALPDPGGIWWTCDYQWSEPSTGCDVVDQRDPLHANDCCYTFGPTVESSEHCNVFLYYFPKATGDVTCF